GLAPAVADEPTKPAAAGAQPAAKPAAANPAPNDDAQFLRRLYLDLSGTLPTPLEVAFFVADADPKKRGKVVGWLLDDQVVKDYLAKKYGDDVLLAPLVVDTDGAGLEYRLLVTRPRVTALAFSPDGRRLAVEETAAGRLVLNEVYGTTVTLSTDRVVVT